MIFPNRRQALIGLATLASMPCLGPTPAQGADGVVKVGVEQDDYFPHYGFRGAQMIGFAYEVLTAFMESAGLTVEYNPEPIIRLNGSLTSGTIDFKYPDNPRWAPKLKKDAPIVYSNSVVAFTDGVLVREADLGKRLGELKSLSAVLGFSLLGYEAEIESNKIRLYSASTLTAAVQMVLAGRVDGVYANVDVAKYTLSELLRAPNQLVYNADLPHIDSGYCLSSVTRPDLIQKFNQWMAAHRPFMMKTAARFGVRLPSPS